MPTKHLIALNIIQKLCEIYKPFGIKFFLLGGQLLGAVRQEAFAGRPQDIDLGLIDIHFDKFIKNIYLIQKNFNFPVHINKSRDRLKRLSRINEQTCMSIFPQFPSNSLNFPM